jgi:tetratricopeptide (TPR) repeat protein
VAVQLRVVDFQGPDRWRWLLTDEHGSFVADHQVALDPTEPEYEAFVDLAGFLGDRAIPDRRLSSEAELVSRVGEWVGRRVLGQRIGRALVDESPVVVEVVLPEDADFLLYRPLELAHVEGVPLARQDVSLVFQVEGEAPRGEKQPVVGRLRLLAVFSLPTGGTALALRRERYGLTRLVRRIATRYRRAIELHVLQYGVTRGRLQAALRDGSGWDLVHFSGHGLAGGLVLEHADGSGDVVDTRELVELLWPARQRLKLVTLSSCLSATTTVAETRRWLALEVPGELAAEASAAAAAPPLPGLARALVGRLGCAVLAMRYPVVDDFAIALDEQLYEGLLGRDQPLARALQLAVPQAAGTAPSPGAPAISVATPALFGPLATGLRLVPPPGVADFNVGTAKMAFFPEEPERFVGRVGVMAQASMVLAPENRERRTGVLAHGMAGAGKTACALELAYRHESVFGALVWWQAPEQGKDITSTLHDLAVAMEAQLPGLAMVQATTSRAALERFLPRLSQLLEERAVLVVLDNLESLLTEQGAWRDPAWGLLVEALVAHSGESRVILTSRVRPQGLDGRVLVKPIHALSLDEALLLARELPNLSRLLDEREGFGGLGRGEPALSGVALVRRVLEVVQGHPKLLELADAQASDLAALRQQLDQVAQALPGQARLGVFFARGETGLGAEQFLRVLGGWTRRVVGGLPAGAQTMLWVLCALEAADRLEPILEATWPRVWARLGHQDQPPPPAATMGLLEAHALVEAVPAGDQEVEGLVRYRVHPGVAEAARAQADPGVQAAVDAELAAFWQAVFWQAMRAEGGEAGQAVVHAGGAAVPYLLRCRDWATAARLLEEALRRDRSPAVVQTLLPLLRQLAQATLGTDQELLNAGRLGRMVSWVDPVEGERQLREVLAQAVAQDDYDTATGIATDLVNLLRDTGRLRQALALVDQMEGFTRQAGLGRWTQLSDHGQRLQLLRRLGEQEQVLVEVDQLREALTGLPETSDQDERVEPWQVREGILQTGMFAALELGRWQRALDLNGEVARSQAARDAPVLVQARTRFNDYGPLLRLGRLQEAHELLQTCRAIYQAEGAVAQLGRVLNAQADLEDKLGHREDAIGLAQIALRYNYVTGDPDDLATGHHNLANYLRRAGRNPTQVVAHRLAAALLYYQSGAGRLSGTLRTLAEELAAFGDQVVPGSFGELAARVGQVEGVRLGELLASLPSPAPDEDAALAEVLRQARDLPAEPADPAQGVVELWAPVLAAIEVAAGGDAEAAAMVASVLTKLDASADWALAGVLRRILAGERGAQLLAGLDPTDTLLVTTLLACLGDQPNDPSGPEAGPQAAPR